MKKTVISLFLLTLMISFSFGQGFVQTGVAPLYNDMFGGTDQLMIDLQSNAGRSILAGTDIGGLYKSDDKAKSWYSINTGLSNLDITTPVIQNPVNHNLLYVGTRGGHPLYQRVGD